MRSLECIQRHGQVSQCCFGLCVEQPYFLFLPLCSAGWEARDHRRMDPRWRLYTKEDSLTVSLYCIYSSLQGFISGGARVSLVKDWPALLPPTGLPRLLIPAPLRPALASEQRSTVEISAPSPLFHPLLSYSLFESRVAQARAVDRLHHRPPPHTYWPLLGTLPIATHICQGSQGAKPAPKSDWCFLSFDKSLLAESAFCSSLPAQIRKVQQRNALTGMGEREMDIGKRERAREALEAKKLSGNPRKEAQKLAEVPLVASSLTCFWCNKAPADRFVRPRKRLRKNIYTSLESTLFTASSSGATRNVNLDG